MDFSLIHTSHDVPTEICVGINVASANSFPLLTLREGSARRCNSSSRTPVRVARFQVSAAKYMKIALFCAQPTVPMFDKAD